MDAVFARQGSDGVALFERRLGEVQTEAGETNVAVFGFASFGGAALFPHRLGDAATPPVDPTDPVDPPIDPDLPPTETRRVVIVQLGERGGPAANLKNIMVSFHAATGPHATGLPLYQSQTETTDGNAILKFSFDTTVMRAGDYGLISVLMPDDRYYLGRVQVL